MKPKRIRRLLPLLLPARFGTVLEWTRGRPLRYLGDGPGAMKTMRLHALWMAAALLAAAPAGAQVVSGSLTNMRTADAVPYATVTITTPEGVVVASTTTDRGGRFTVHLDAGGPYVLRVTEPGFHRVVRRFTVADNATFTYRARMSEIVNDADRDHSSSAWNRGSRGSSNNRGAPPPPSGARPREN
jgi:Carboxypeptidase regulatory-like domain